jgi:hypothetical protein
MEVAPDQDIFAKVANSDNAVLAIRKRCPCKRQRETGRYKKTFKHEQLPIATIA